MPLLASLRRTWPESEIDWLVQDSFVEAIRAHPDLTEAIPFPRRAFAALWRPSTLAAAMGWVAALRRRRYDLVIDAQGLGRSGLLAWCTGAARRVGFADAREGGWLGCTTRIRVDAVHAVDRMLALLPAIGVEPVHDMRLYAAVDDVSWWRSERNASVADAPYAVIAPGSRWPGKCWPPSRWRVLAKELLGRGMSVVAVGARDEREQVRVSMPTDVPDGAAVDLAGRTSVGQTMAVIADAALVVANDSAPLHMAVGFARPLVGLFGATDPAKVGPYGRLDAVVRAPSAPRAAVHFKDTSRAAPLMAEITPEMVLACVDRELDRSAAGATR